MACPTYRRPFTVTEVDPSDIPRNTWQQPTSGRGHLAPYTSELLNFSTDDRMAIRLDFNTDSDARAAYVTLTFTRKNRGLPVEICKRAASVYLSKKL